MDLRTRTPLTAGLAALACSAGLIGCGGGSATSPTSTGSTAGSSGFPFTYTDCGGTAQTITAPAKRVVAMEIDASDLVRTTGFGDRLIAIGAVAKPADVPPGVAHIGKFNSYPSKDEVLAQRPDLVVSPYGSALGPKGAFPQSQLNKLGIRSYYSLSGCGPTGIVHDLNVVTRDVNTLGRIFGRPDLTNAVVARFNRQLAAAAPRAAGRRPTVWVYEGTKDPASYGGNLVPNAVIWLAGGRNVFEDTRDYNTVSTEAVLKRDPDIIWVMPDAGFGGISDGPGAGGRIEKKLETDPVLSQLTAVRKHRFAVVPFSTGAVANLKNPQAVAVIAAEVRKVRAGG
ncbi:MAG: ABC transporter substrate-binding protein [Thermoleophilia bacterium]